MDVRMTLSEVVAFMTIEVRPNDVPAPQEDVPSDSARMWA